MKSLRPRTFDLLVVAMYVVAEAVAIVHPVEGSRVAQLLLPALWTLPLLAHKRAPVGVVVTVFAALALESHLAHPATESTAVLPPVIGAFWVAGTIRERANSLVTAAVGLTLTTVIVAGNAGKIRATDLLFIALLTTAPFAAGLVAATREARAVELERRAMEAERDRDLKAQAAVREERARIARDLHDIVGHAISVMMVQTGAARLVVEKDPAGARAALLAVEANGREALGEMRRMLSVLHTEGGEPLEPQRGLADLEHLVAANRDAGLEVAVETEGAPPEISPGIELAAYRIVQEALTNVRKHSSERRARLRIRFEPNAMHLAVENDGAIVAPPDARGHGIQGMRERVALYAGELSAGPRQEGGFAVRVRLPFTGGVT